MDKLFPLIVPADMEKPQAFTVPVEHSNSPHSEAIIIGRVENKRKERKRKLEPTESVSNHCNDIVAQVVCKVEEGILLVRLIIVTLKGGVKMVMMHTDIEVGSKAITFGRLTHCQYILGYIRKVLRPLNCQPSVICCT